MDWSLPNNEQENIRRNAVRQLMGLKAFPDYGDLYPLKQFQEAVKFDSFVSSDGSAYYANDYGWSDEPFDFRDPNKATKYTHVMWFNK